MESIDYSHWRIDRIYLLTPAQALVGQWLTSFKQFPPRQKPASFNLDQVMKLDVGGLGLSSRQASQLAFPSPVYGGGRAHV